MFQKYGIKKGDSVMLILKRNYQFWFSIVALHKIGAIVIPATYLLTTSDIVYRNNAADVKMIVSTNESEVFHHVEEAQAESLTLETKILLGKNEKDGFASTKNWKMPQVNLKDRQAKKK